jgi:exodeoxyribonuclease V alpha subunit
MPWGSVETGQLNQVCNGDIGVIATIDMEEGALQVDYDGRLVGYEFGELGELLCLILARRPQRTQGKQALGV